MILLTIKRSHLHSNIKRKGILQQLGLPHHEYWTWWLLVIPVWPLWIWYALKLRCSTWFTAVNPGMEDSGFLGESKWKILSSIPEAYKPLSIFITVSEQINIEDAFKKSQLTFPVICKPDIGGRGRKVECIHDMNALIKYHEFMTEDYMVQNLIPYEMELGIFYVRLPNETKGKITSIAAKEFLKVKGDGKSSIKILMQQSHRASLQIERLRQQIDLNKILPLHEEVILEPIGNHCRGTAFIDYGHLINDKLNEVFDNLSKQIEGFNYGRFDLKVRSIEDLYLGKTIQIMELNGLTADAAHIFDPSSRLRDAYATQIKQCKLSYNIAKQHLKNNVRPTPLFEIIKKSYHYFSM